MRAIQRTSTIAAPAHALEISYSRAWLLVRSRNAPTETIGPALVVSSPRTHPLSPDLRNWPRPSVGKDPIVGSCL